jgi:sec-independent protein translocase protein TatA
MPPDIQTGEKMFHLGTTELIVILVIVLLLFGVGRISKIAGELGKGISSFRTALKGDEETPDADKDKKE